jgi:hypothetical protein
VKQADDTNFSRRDLAALLGAVGVPAGLAALTGCREGADTTVSPDEATATVAAALNGTDIRWVSTVLGASPSSGTRPGDLATRSGQGSNVRCPGMAIGCTIAIAQGCVTPGDGGGGIFYWDASSSTGDDGGTVIVPSSCPWGSQGRWVRIYSGPLNVRWFGAVGDGTTSDTAAIQAALNAAPNAVDVLFPRGSYVVDRTLAVPTTATRIKLHGSSSTLGLEGADSRIWCRAVNGPLLSFTGAPPAIALVGLEIDGSDGASGSLTAYSTTWSGLWGAQSGVWQDIHIHGCKIHCSACPQAKAIDLTNACWALIENANISGMAVGWAVYVVGAVGSTTTITLRKVYLNYNLECVFLGGQTLNFDAYDTVFESSLIALSAYDKQINLVGCYFENIGYWGPTGSPSQGTALTLQNMGIGNGSTAPVNTALHVRQGNLVLRGCQLTYLNTGVVAWVRGVGLGQSYGADGRVTFDLCRRTLNPNDVLIAPETAPATRAGFSFAVNDPPTVVTGGPPSYTAGSGGVVQTYADARAVTSGRVMIPFSAGDVRPVEVQNSSFVYGQFPDNAYNDALSSAPAGGTNLVGDRVLNAAPAPGSSLGWICVVAGSPGTWKAYAPIST